MPVTEGEKLLERTIVGMEQQKQAVKVYFVRGTYFIILPSSGWWS